MAVTTSSGNAAPAAENGPGVTDIVEFTRIIAPWNSDEQQLQQQVSPDGTRAFIVTRKANTRTDRNRYEILLLDVRPQRLALGRYEPPALLAALEPVIDDNSRQPSVQDVRWAGNTALVFRARLRDAMYQVFQVDVRTRVLTQLTHAPTGVMSYATSDDLRTVLYAARLNNPPLAEGRRSIVVGNQSFWSVKHGQNDMVPQERLYQYFVAERGRAHSPRRLGPAVLDASSPQPPLSLSPDGRWALLPRYEAGRQLEWARHYPLVAEATAEIGPALLMDPQGYFARPHRYVPKRMLAYRVSDGTARTIVDAPDDTTGVAPLHVLWQAHGDSVVIAGTHLPRSGAGPQGDGSYIVEYWPVSGRVEVIAAVSKRVTALRSLAQAGFSVSDGQGSRTFVRRAGGGWQQTDAAAALPSAGDLAEASWRLRVRQDLNVPPEIVAEGPTGRSVPLTRLNTQVTPAWGTMKPYGWKDAGGRQWDGGLLVPAGFEPGRRRALVIQTYGFTPTRFYLDGANIAEAFTSGFAGRAFLRHDMLVLAFPSRATTGAPRGNRESIAAFMDGVRGAVDALVADGLVDRARVGIMGWSMTGERVLNQITFSDLPLRAATILDGDANTLFSMTVTYGFSDNMLMRKESTNGGAPFGDSLATWVRNDPSLHTDCVKAALRIETYGPWVTNNWDIYALLRRQYKAVEMVVIPHGTHGLHTPSERMLSLQGNVDWHRFWLTGGERTEPYLLGESDETLREQYRRWQQMARMKEADDARPDCARKSEGF